MTFAIPFLLNFGSAISLFIYLLTNFCSKRSLRLLIQRDSKPKQVTHRSMHALLHLIVKKSILNLSQLIEHRYIMFPNKKTNSVSHCHTRNYVLRI